MSPQTETALINACYTLFGEGLFITKDFLWYLQPAGLKAAYRQKAKEAHPDRFSHLDPQLRQKQTAFFQEVNQAYDLLLSFFHQRERQNRVTKQPPERKNSTEAKTTHAAFRRVPEKTLEFGQYLYTR
ncbi:MAG: DnaJ domain-containing protein, partial [Desulfuromonadales bacterium]|nr:DnaJ domain-containing protein [Desulfuromonadales bacterium]